MADTRREQLFSFVERELIGPDPIDWEGFRQDNGEEILMTDPPRLRYIAGILYPQETIDADADAMTDEVKTPEESDSEDEYLSSEQKGTEDIAEYLEDAEELINRSNAYRQSAISLTAAVRKRDIVKVKVSAGTYRAVRETEKDSGKDLTRYFRIPVDWNNENLALPLPVAGEGIRKIPVDNTGLQFDVTCRHQEDEFSIYTFTLENVVKKTSGIVRDEDCFFQIKFTIYSERGFQYLPDSQRVNEGDEDYLSNRLLYRKVKNYAIGHGCGTEWDEGSDKVSWISTAIFPSYEIKPILPGVIPGVSLEMLKMSSDEDFEATIDELKLMCDKYNDWITELKKDASEIDAEFSITAERHIKNCEQCLMRMRSGIELLQKEKTVRLGFQYMNLAMLMQQLHYNLPLQKWEDDGQNDIRLINPAELPSVTDDTTWYGKEDRVYGKWRPFQLAFILMNLHSMYDNVCDERKIIDLIWFPTGGGKTEAYLGLSAYTIFVRRLKNKKDKGTAILMRYTLRLLTAQQYERAATLICACDLIRKNNEDLFGSERISIGLWVGAATTPNKMKDALSQFHKMKQGASDINPFVILKCPWCGAQMGIVKRGKNRAVIELAGYEQIMDPRGKKSIAFKCRNTQGNCPFSDRSYSLPLHVIDETIYESTPTLVLGTVDKFAMLPFLPEAQGIFGFKNGVKVNAPDLIIQDELHLISGPLGSMVGHYETLINELCTTRTANMEISPKIIASTATISRAKEQCHALYACSPDKVFQFPPAGLDAGNSFFAEEGKSENGRRYIGIMASGSSSDATTAIRLISVLLYGVKEMGVEEEKLRDPYWTNVGYFNSIRELGQAATWIRADIDQYLDVLYKRRNFHKKYSREEYQKRRRYIRRDEELTSRIRGDKVTASLANLNLRYPPEADENPKIKENPIDICLATNMISVGLDVPRLGLMTVFGQPKTTSEYIQATSRVGRSAKDAPGLIFVLYRPGRPRDRSHYELFRLYHSRVYCNVEPTSVTPFSSPVRERALHAIIIGMMRLKNNVTFNQDPPHLPDQKMYEEAMEIIKDRIKTIDPDELDAALEEMREIIQNWNDWLPQSWKPQYNYDGTYRNTVPLLFYSGSHPNEAWGGRGMETPTSMRNVDASCEAYVLPNRYSP